MRAQRYGEGERSFFDAVDKACENVVRVGYFNPAQIVATLIATRKGKCYRFTTLRAFSYLFSLKITITSQDSSRGVPYSSSVVVVRGYCGALQGNHPPSRQMLVLENLIFVMHAGKYLSLWLHRLSALQSEHQIHHIAAAVPSRPYLVVAFCVVHL